MLIERDLKEPGAAVPKTFAPSVSEEANTIFDENKSDGLTSARENNTTLNILVNKATHSSRTTKNDDAVVSVIYLY